MNLVLVDVQADALERAEAEMKGAGATVMARRVDVSDAGQMESLAEEVYRLFGAPHFVFNNAGVGARGKVDELSVADWDRVFAVNLRGVFLMTRAVVPPMRRQGGGHIVNISSVAGLVGNPGLSAYNATKFGLMGFSEAMMLELRHDRIKVTALCPGSTDTHFSGEPGRPERAHHLSVEDVTHALVEVVASAPNALISQLHLRPLVPPSRG